ncbi:MAG: 2-amino-4-hydroxy-6-hydroxymethyldihydropteridine diphosphokinase [Porticoccaceae bacterium]
MSSTAYIALGSNLDDPSAQIHRALAALAHLPQTELTDCAAWYRSAAVGPGTQADYINTVVRLYTELAPMDLLHALQAIETAQGRTRTQHWGARTLDLDILLYDDLSLNTAELTLPHPRLTERNFVLAPLHDLAPELLLSDGKTIERSVKQWLANCGSTGIVQL